MSHAPPLSSLMMSAIVDIPAAQQSFLFQTDRKLRGLSGLSSDLVSEAIDETNAQVTRTGLTFIGTTAFCLLSLLSPDSAILGGSEKINVPLAGPVSFFGFMLLAPAVLVLLRVYLQIYVEHSSRLELIGRWIGTKRAPTLIPLKNPLMRTVGGLTFYLLLPLAMLLFAWKAAVFASWAAGLLGVTVGVIASHAMLLFGKVSWRSNLLLSMVAAIAVAATLPSLKPLRRPFNLYHSNLSNQWLAADDLSGANMAYADLSGSKLIRANLRGANLYGANLTGVDLFDANLYRANLEFANLSGARLNGTELGNTNLSAANLTGADLFAAQLAYADLSGSKLDGADLHGANLRYTKMTHSTKLSGADLSEAILIDAHLTGVDLSGADLRGTNLIGADLTGADLTQARNFSEACGDRSTKLPEGITIKECPQ